MKELLEKLVNQIKDGELTAIEADKLYWEQLDSRAMASGNIYEPSDYVK